MSFMLFLLSPLSLFEEHCVNMVRKTIWHKELLQRRHLWEVREPHSFGCIPLPNPLSQSSWGDYQWRTGIDIDWRLLATFPLFLRSGNRSSGCGTKIKCQDLLWNKILPISSYIIRILIIPNFIVLLWLIFFPFTPPPQITLSLAKLVDRSLWPRPLQSYLGSTENHWWTDSPRFLKFFVVIFCLSFDLLLIK